MTQESELYNAVREVLFEHCPVTAVNFENTVSPTNNVITDTNRFLRTSLCSLNIDTRRERLALDDEIHPSIWLSEVRGVVGNGFLA